MHSRGQANNDRGPGPPTLKNAIPTDTNEMFFWWVYRFQLDKTTLDIEYGTKEFLIEPMMYYSRPKAALAAWEILTAAQVPDLQPVLGASRVDSTKLIREKVERMSAAIIAHWPLLSDPPQEIIELALFQREQRRLSELQEQMLRLQEQRSIERESACRGASVCFHSNNYPEAVDLLEPYQHNKELPKSSAMILHMAKKKLI